MNLCDSNIGRQDICPTQRGCGWSVWTQPRSGSSVPTFSGATNVTGFTFMTANEARFGQKSVPVGHKMTLERRLCLRGTDIRPAWTRFPHVDGKGAGRRSKRSARRRDFADEGRVGREVEKVPTVYRALDAPSIPALHQSRAQRLFPLEGCPRCSGSFPR